MCINTKNERTLISTLEPRLPVLSLFRAKFDLFQGTNADIVIDRDGNLKNREPIFVCPQETNNEPS